MCKREVSLGEYVLGWFFIFVLGAILGLNIYTAGIVSELHQDMAARQQRIEEIRKENYERGY